jgi:hypothetical protein
VLLHLVLVVIGLRRDRYEDREVTRQLAGVTVLVPGDAGEVIDPARPGKGHWLAILGMCVAPCLLFAPAAYQQLKGWPSSDDVEPHVVGPGDEVTVAFSDHGINAGRGPWKGEAKLEVLNPKRFGRFRELPVKPLPLDRDTDPSVHFRLPARPQLEGATLEARVRLTVHYPELGTRSMQKKTLVKKVSVTLAETGCGEALGRAGSAGAETGCGEALGRAWSAGWVASGLTYLASAGAILALSLARRPTGAALWPGRD